MVGFPGGFFWQPSSKKLKDMYCLQNCVQGEMFMWVEITYYAPFFLPVETQRE